MLMNPHEVALLGSTVTMVVLISNGLYKAFGLTSKYVGIVVSGCAAICWLALSESQSVQAWFLVIPNAFVIYTGAVGISTMMGKRHQASEQLGGGGVPTAIAGTATGRRFWIRWFG